MQVKTLMNKLQIIICGVALFAALPAHAEGYVRKNVRPQYFIPENVFNQPEKLPPITTAKNRSSTPKNISRNGNRRANKPAAVLMIDDAPKQTNKKSGNQVRDVLIVEDTANLPKTKPASARRDNGSSDVMIVNPCRKKNLGVAYTNPPSNSPSAAIAGGPSFSTIKKSYDNDLNIMKKTGNMPANQQLKRSLQKMDSNAAFIVK